MEDSGSGKEGKNEREKGSFYEPRKLWVEGRKWSWDEEGKRWEEEEGA